MQYQKKLQKHAGTLLWIFDTIRSSKTNLLLVRNVFGSAWFGNVFQKLLRPALKYMKQESGYRREQFVWSGRSKVLFLLRFCWKLLSELEETALLEKGLLEYGPLIVEMDGSDKTTEVSL